jgi:hypothetical protein
VGQCLRRKPEVLSTSPSITKKKKKLSKLESLPILVKRSDAHL